MRFGVVGLVGLVGLALSAIAIGACDEPHAKDNDAVACMAYLSLQSMAVSEGRAAGDVAALDAANALWRGFAEAKYAADELAQYFASSVAVLDEIEPAELTAIAATCAGAAPQG
jgi:hypothetical protein